MSDDFEEWKAWFDSHKDEDGRINLSKHPELLAYMERFVSAINKMPECVEDINFDGLCNFEFASVKKH